jgi:hypothetical protein
MSRFSFRFSLVAAVAVLAGAPERASAAFVPYAHDAQAALTNGMRLLRRALHLGQDEVVSHAISLSSREAALELELAGGRTRTVALQGGVVLIDGARAGRYTRGGRLERAWRRLLADGGALDTRGLLVALRAWHAPSASGEDAVAGTRIEESLQALGVVRGAPAGMTAVARADSARARFEGAARPVSITLRDLAALDSLKLHLGALEDVGGDVGEAVRTSPMHLGDYEVAAGQRVDGDVVVFKGDAEVFGEVTGNVVALYGDVAYHRGARIGKNAVSVGGQVLDRGGTVRGDIRTVSEAELSAAAPEPEVDVEPATRVSPLNRVVGDASTVVAFFVALAMLGFGAVFFGRRYVETVADTATHSFGRSLVVGLLGQLLLLPTFAMLIVGLIFTIVGILLLPVVVPAFVVAACAAVLGGYLAVAHAVGETFTRRRMAHGAFVRAPNAYGYLFTGLLGLLGLWAAAALTGWMGPVVILFRAAALIVTWLAATVGFGAVLLSRAGLRETFAGRHLGEMSDEYLWATPPATPTAARMNAKD